MITHLQKLNAMLKNPTKTNIFNIFSRDGYLRFNMLYVSPLVFKFLKEKLAQYNLTNWYFTQNELIFEFTNLKIKFRGCLNVSGTDKIFCVELDFDPIIPKNCSLFFLSDVETFLKKSDSIFFMTYGIFINSDILSQPLPKSMDYLMYKNTMQEFH